LALASRHLQAVQAEREREREARAALREEQRVAAELAKEREKLAKEQQHYLNALEALRARGDAAGAAQLEARLADIEQAIADVESLAANQRAGYVYVISNIGAFGPDMVKIGMTRRLDPMDRVRELGDASVPFRYDTHALFFTKDAVGVETMLHQTFAAQRVNKVNPRREFYRVTPTQVLDALRARDVAVVEFRVEPEAEEYRQSGGAV
jgi:vacuolar-type H+-ATPase subunit I/STV1